MKLQAAVLKAQWLGLLALLSLSQLMFWQLSSDPFAPVQHVLIKVLVPLALLPWLARSGADWKATLNTLPGRLALGWMAWLWVSAILSPFQGDGLKTALEYSLYSILFFLPAACTVRERQALLSAFFGAALVAGAYGFLQHYGVDPWRWSTDFGGRPLGTIGNPNFFGGHMVLAWGLALGWLLSHGPGHRRYPALAFALLTAVLWFARSVGPWIGMAGAATVALVLLLLPNGELLRERTGLTRKRLAQALGALALVAALLYFSPLRAKLAQEKSLSVTNRLMMWKVAGQLWQSAPVQGAGLGSYRPLYPEMQAKILEAEPKAGWNYVVTWLPHQNYLYLLAETGLIGLGLFLGLWGLALWHGVLGALGGRRESLMALLAIAGLLGVGLLNTFSNIPPTALGFFFLAGLLVWPPLAPQSSRPLSTEALAISLGLALFLGIPAAKELVANRLTREGGRYVKRTEHAGAVPFIRKAAEQGHANFTPQSLVGVNFQLGEALRNSGRLEEAVAAYREDLKANPHAPEVHNMLGAALGQWGAATRRIDFMAESAEHLRTADRLNPGYTAALLNLGGSYMILGNLSGAAKTWERVLELDPEHKEARAYLLQLKARR